MRYGPFDIKHGDRVHFLDAAGRMRNGKAVGPLMFPKHLVLNMGGPHGSPAVVYPDMIISVKPRKERKALRAAAEYPPGYGPNGPLCRKCGGAIVLCRCVYANGDEA